MLIKFKFLGEEAENISYLLYKNPNNLFKREINSHTMYLFYKKCILGFTAFNFFVEVNTEAIRRNDIYDASDYVNDRAHALSSITTAAMKKCFGSAMRGDQPEGFVHLVDKEFKFEVELISFTNSPRLSINLFESLGYTVTQKFTRKGSQVYSLKVDGKSTVKDILSQLYILIPVIDNHSHIYSDVNEVDKIIRFGGDWLTEHPYKEMIINRYLQYRASLVKHFKEEAKETTVEEEIEAPKIERLGDKRYASIKDILKNYGSKKIIDFGCGGGKLTLKIEEDAQRVLAVDSYYPALERLKIKSRKNPKIDIKLGNVYYFDQDYAGYDSVVLCEVIEHLNYPNYVMENIFENIKPELLVVTTPNRNYNYHYGMIESEKRHRDHKFEWNTEEFKSYIQSVQDSYGYDVEYVGVGDPDEDGEYATVIAVLSNNPDKLRETALNWKERKV